MSVFAPRLKHMGGDRWAVVYGGPHYTTYLSKKNLSLLDALKRQQKVEEKMREKEAKA